MDAMDAALDGEALSQMVEQFEQHPSARTYTSEKADVVHATLSEDVEALIAKRKKRPGKQQS
jgi:hypothetical protein